MAYLVYKLTNSVNGKAYVGITARSLDTRWLEHCARARQGARTESRLYSALRKYGLDVFIREVIGTCDTEDEARAAETAFIRELGTYERGYNANEGGHGWLHVPENVRRKSSASQKGREIDTATRAKMSAAKLGDPRCADHLAAHTRKGSDNPRAKAYLVSLPDGSEQVIVGLRAFMRANGVASGAFRRGCRSNGFKRIATLSQIPTFIATSMQGAN